MKYVVVLFLFLALNAFSEVIHFECTAYKKIDSFGHIGIQNSNGKRQYMTINGYKWDDRGRKDKIILDTEKLTLTQYDTIAKCKISKDQDSYICEKSSIDGHGSNYFHRYEINRRNLNYKHYVSITNNPDGEEDYFDDGEGKCQREQDIQF